MLDPSYTADLNQRLVRFQEKTGYAIYIVLTRDDPNRSLYGIVWELFQSNGLESKGSAGAVLVLIEIRSGQVGIALSKNLRRKFSGSQVEYRIGQLLNTKHLEWAMERTVHAILAQIDPWFYRLDPSSVKPGMSFVRSPMAEVLLFPLAPVLGLMTGVILMTFTAAGSLPAPARFLMSGSLGFFIVLVAVFLIRQPGGILPGMFYYSVGVGFAVSAAVGA